MIHVTEYASIDKALRYVDAAATKHINDGKSCYVCVCLEKPDQRITKKQRGALHIFCANFAKALNDAGFQRKKHLFSNGVVVDVDWNMITFKEDIYKPMLAALTNMHSTEDQLKVTPEQVSSHLNRYFGQNYGITVEWPSNQSIKP